MNLFATSFTEGVRLSNRLAAFWTEHPQPPALLPPRVDVQIIAFGHGRELKTLNEQGLREASSGEVVAHKTEGMQGWWSEDKQNRKSISVLNETEAAWGFRSNHVEHTHHLKPTSQRTLNAP